MTGCATYSFRPVRLPDAEDEVNDLPFLQRLYASTREDEMAYTGWAAEDIDAFLLQQFHAQHQYYWEQFAGASFEVILDGDGDSIGRLYWEEREDEFRVIDIALLPGMRGKGIGGSIMRNIIDDASSLGKAVRIHVEQYNPAMRLYTRLGFQMVEEQGAYHLMEHPAPAPALAE